MDRLLNTVEVNDAIVLVERFCKPVLLNDCKTEVLVAIVFISFAVNAATELLDRVANALVERLAICAVDNAANCDVVRLLRKTEEAAAKAVVEILATCVAESVCKRVVLVANALISLLEILDPE